MRGAVLGVGTWEPGPLHALHARLGAGVLGGVCTIRPASLDQNCLCRPTAVSQMVRMLRMQRQQYYLFEAALQQQQQQQAVQAQQQLQQRLAEQRRLGLT